MDNRNTYAHTWEPMKALTHRVSSQKWHVVCATGTRAVRAFCVSKVVLHTLTRAYPAAWKNRGEQPDMKDQHTRLSVVIATQVGRGEM